MYNEIVSGLVKKIPDKKECGFTFLDSDNKKMYTASIDSKGVATYTTKVKITQLNYDFFDPDMNCDMYGENDIKELNIDDLVTNIEENFYRPEYSYLKFVDGKAKLKIFENRNFDIDKIIEIDESNNKTMINGIILDFCNDLDFIDTYKNGIVCDMPNCISYYSDIKDVKDDEERFRIASKYEESIRDEIEFLFLNTLDKVKGGVEAVVSGLYVIIDNKLYYLTAEEYNTIYRNVNYLDQDKIYNLNSIPGLNQLNEKLIVDKKQALNTIKAVAKDMSVLSLNERNYVDLDNLSIESRQEFISGLLSNDDKVYNYLEEELKPHFSKEKIFKK